MNEQYKNTGSLEVRFTEEVGEALQALGKCWRFGAIETHPQNPTGPTNRQHLIAELDGVLRTASELRQYLATFEPTEALSELPFVRQVRYTVMKHKDANRALTQSEIRTLNSLSDKVHEWRLSKGKAPFTCVVVESNWPEYEPTWKAIQDRVEQEEKNHG